jgi:hypothetical protein
MELRRSRKVLIFSIVFGLGAAWVLLIPAAECGLAKSPPGGSAETFRDGRPGCC